MSFRFRLGHDFLIEGGREGIKAASSGRGRGALLKQIYPTSRPQRSTSEGLPSEILDNLHEVDQLESLSTLPKVEISLAIWSPTTSPRRKEIVKVKNNNGLNKANLMNTNDSLVIIIFKIEVYDMREDVDIQINIRENLFKIG